MSKKLPTLQQVAFEKLLFLDGQDGRPLNPNVATDQDIDGLCRKIKKDPNFAKLRPSLAIQQPDGFLLVYAGEQRARAQHLLGRKVWVKSEPPEWVTHEMMMERAVIDNTHAGKIDADRITSFGFTKDELVDMGVPLTVFNFSEQPGESSPQLTDEEIKRFFQPDADADGQAVDAKMKIVLEYTEDEYRQVREGLSKVAKTPESAVWQLLKLGDQ